MRGLEEDKAFKEKQQSHIFGPLRGAQLQSYVANVRNALYAEQTKAKKDRYNEAIKLYVFLKFYLLFVFGFFISMDFTGKKN